MFLLLVLHLIEKPNRIIQFLRWTPLAYASHSMVCFHVQFQWFSHTQNHTLIFSAWHSNNKIVNGCAMAWKISNASILCISFTHLWEHIKENVNQTPQKIYGLEFGLWAYVSARAFSPITHTRCKRFTQILSYDMYAILQKTIFFTNEIFHMAKYFWIRPHFLSIDICKRLQSIVYLLRVRFGWNARCTLFFPLCSAIYSRWTHFKCKRTKQMQKL